MMIPTRQLHAICTWCIRNHTAAVTGATMPAPGILTGTISQLMTRRRMSATERSRPANYVMVRIANCRLAGSRHLINQELICVRKRLRPSRNMRPQNIRARPAASSPRGPSGALFPLPEPGHRVER
jgi:hypothetical protein